MIVFVHDWGSYFVVGVLWNSIPALFFTAVGQQQSFDVTSCPLGRVQHFWGLPWRRLTRVLSSDGFHPHVPSAPWPGIHCLSPQQN